MLLICTGCKTELYSEISEKEANEMLSILLDAGINSDRVAGKEGTWTVRTSEKKFSKAVTLLKDHGYPKDQYDNIGGIFKKQGLVTSPLEDRIRFIYALSQELSLTLSYIDGILNARVHVVLPENNPNTYNEVLQPSSASVFIRHQQQADISARIPQIKELVVNSIEGLTYDKVTIVLFPANAKTPPVQLDIKQVSAGSNSTAQITQSKFFKGAVGLFLVFATVGIYFLKGRKPRPAKDMAPEDEDQN
ncbi:MAG: EscJ/YscJ/HrcJ family type III secretion inner membrane ring protein [Desulfobacteraceae bacterium]|nr:EscJ/YscJ/HrcJ family type III secretion inner membrane ring protein [Desulfobacteraceae bacterium]